MERIYKLAACGVSVELNDGIVRVFSNAELWRFLDGEVNSRFNLLARTIKSDYVQIFNKPLNIADDSLIVEILVHVYCDYLGLSFNRIFKIKPVQKLVKSLLKRAEVVDCGERAKDTNRWVWDALARFKPLFMKLLPKNLNRTNLKLH